MAKRKKQQALAKDLENSNPELDDACAAVLTNKRNLLVLRDALRSSQDDVQSLIKSNKLRQYSYDGHRFFIDPGSPSLKIAKLKTDA